MGRLFEFSSMPIFQSHYFEHPLQPEGPGVHVLHGEGEPPPFAPFHLTALSILFVLGLLHLGHGGFSCEERTSSSKTSLQASHLYSKIGILFNQFL
jgi:hypothetical protein